MVIKIPDYTESANGISVNKNNIEASLDRIDYPIFCFRHVHKDCSVEKCLSSDKSFIRQFIKKIDRVSRLSWDEIKFSDKQGVGTEKIAINSIKKSLPDIITEDVEFLLSFYFNGKKGRIIGYRNKHIFHILYIDTRLEVYGH